MNEQLKPSYDLKLEKAVIGAILLESTAIDEVIGILKTPDVFYDEAHQVIFKACKDLYDRGKPIDILTVAQELKATRNFEKSKGGVYITQLTNSVNSSANIEFHARLVLQHWVKRKLMVLGHMTYLKSAQDSTDGLELLEKIENQLLEISQGFSDGNIQTLKEMLPSAMHQIGEEMRQEGLPGVPTGFHWIDEATGGFRKTDLFIIGARPGMGKTAFVITALMNAGIRFNKKVAFFSLEMSKIQIIKRILSSWAKVNVGKLNSGKITEDEYDSIMNSCDALMSDNIFIDDTPNISVSQIKSEISKLSKLISQETYLDENKVELKKELDLVVIDYLGLINPGKGDTREQEIANMTRGLKIIAKELKVPIVLLSQLSRDVEKRGGEKKPSLSDLRESGSIEQDADEVAFLYRPSYYKITEDEAGNDITNLAEFILAKNRHGELKTIDMEFIGEYTTFVDWENN